MKIKIKNIVLGLFFLIYNLNAYCQFYDGIVWVVIDNEANKPHELYTKNPTLNEILEEYEISKFTKVFPFSRNHFLLSVYKIEFKGLTDDFINAIQTRSFGSFKDIIKVPIEEQIQVNTYNPSDYM